MVMYGLRTAEGRWLPRDAQRRALGETLHGPDLWQDLERAKHYAKAYRAELVEFNVATYVDRHGHIRAGHGKGET